MITTVYDMNNEERVVLITGRWQRTIFAAYKFFEMVLLVTLRNDL